MHNVKATFIIQALIIPSLTLINTKHSLLLIHYISNKYLHNNMAIENVKAVAIAIGFIFLNFAGQCYGYYGYGGLQYGFYNGKCRASDVETIVRNTVYSKFLKDRTIAPALIQMQFHDCFVNVSFFYFQFFMHAN